MLFYSFQLSAARPRAPLAPAPDLGKPPETQVNWMVDPAMSTAPSQSKQEPGASTRSPIRLQARPPQLAGLDMTRRVGRNAYEKELARLQLRLKETATAYWIQKRRAVVVFEGWDSAGKGGVIRRMNWTLDPRMFKVCSIAAPTPQELEQHYLQRFWKSLPGAGELVAFDRSWYGRVLVERVENFASESEWRRAYEEINEFEHMLVDSGARIVKIFLHITKDEQLARFRGRFKHPLKRWKLSEEDLRNRSRWAEYETATEDMLRLTSTEAIPWTVIPANDKRYARLTAIGKIVDCLSRGVELQPPPLAPDFERLVRMLLQIDDEKG